MVVENQVHPVRVGDAVDDRGAEERRRRTALDRADGIQLAAELRLQQNRGRDLRRHVGIGPDRDLDLRQVHRGVLCGERPLDQDALVDAGRELDLSGLRLVLARRIRQCRIDIHLNAVDRRVVVVADLDIDLKRAGRRDTRVNADRHELLRGIPVRPAQVALVDRDPLLAGREDRIQHAGRSALAGDPEPQRRSRRNRNGRRGGDEGRLRDTPCRVHRHARLSGGRRGDRNRRQSVAVDTGGELALPDLIRGRGLDPEVEIHHLGSV